MNGNTKIQVGYELDLYAQHDPGVKADPGCHECRDLHDILKILAIQVLPKENRPSRYQIEEFDAAFHIRPETNLKVEVVLKMLIIHREDFFAPVDLCEQKCSAEIQRNLARLGVQPKVWSQKLRQRNLKEGT